VVLLIDNYDSFTWNLVQAVGALIPNAAVGRDVVVVRHDEVTPEQVETLDRGRPPSRIIISPGPCTPREAGVSVAVIERFAGRVRILGVCLGHQAIGAAFGMRVVRSPRPIHGKPSPVHHDGRGVFAGLQSPLGAARYHSLVVEEASVTPGWEVSAWTNGPEGRLVMGLRRQGPGAPVEGVQFHPESFMTPEGSGLLRNFLNG
jgi:anthranilate synthase component 2